jgi:hypothetical protein
MGVVHGISAGSAVISYTTSTYCGTSTATYTVNVTSSAYAGTISGSTSVVAGSNITLSETVTGGTWSSSTTSVATVSASGLVHGVAAGTTTITYTVTSCGTAYTNYVVTVTPSIPPNIISGTIHFTGTYYRDSVKVWLITYNPSTLMLQAIDSTIVYAYDTMAFYQFNGEPNDSMRVKAAITNVTGTTGYLPTYHTNSFYWYSATVFYHAGGTDYGKDIYMNYGTVTPGPGFIGGNVTTGANRGTSGGVAVKGLNMIALNSAGAPVQSVRTDAGGNYSFSSLPLDTYTIFPDSLNYLTTPYTTITLTSAASSMSTASFIQHTLSHTITPIGTSVANTLPAVASINTYPNPTTGQLSILWQEPTAEKGRVSIKDIAGREVFNTTIDMTQGAGVKRLDLSSLSDGTYMINVNSASFDYNNKIQIAH